MSFKENSTTPISTTDKPPFVVESVNDGGECFYIYNKPSKSFLAGLTQTGRIIMTKCIGNAQIFNKDKRDNAVEICGILNCLSEEAKKETERIHREVGKKYV